jgi:hypothetical protein
MSDYFGKQELKELRNKELRIIGKELENMANNALKDNTLILMYLQNFYYLHHREKIEDDIFNGSNIAMYIVSHDAISITVNDGHFIFLPVAPINMNNCKIIIEVSVDKWDAKKTKCKYDVHKLYYRKHIT